MPHHHWPHSNCRSRWSLELTFRVQYQSCRCCAGSTRWASLLLVASSRMIDLLLLNSLVESSSHFRFQPLSFHQGVLWVLEAFLSVKDWLLSMSRSLRKQSYLQGSIQLASRVGKRAWRAFPPLLLYQWQETLVLKHFNYRLWWRENVNRQQCVLVRQAHQKCSSGHRPDFDSTFTSTQIVALPPAASLTSPGLSQLRIYSRWQSGPARIFFWKNRLPARLFEFFREDWSTLRASLVFRGAGDYCFYQACQRLKSQIFVHLKAF